MDDFDYGVPDEQLNSHIGNNIKKWPTEGSVVLLLDADSIPYVVGYTSDHVQYLNAENDPAGFEESQMFKDKCDHANYLLNDWVKKAGADSAILFVTNNKDNFRLGLFPEYKEDRSEEEKPKPPFFHEIKQWLIDFHDARISYKCEADDEISMEAWRRLKEEACEMTLFDNTHKVWSGYVIGSMDKDLNMIPGWHVNQATGQKFWVQGIGQLDPIWKVREVTNYEYHPLFDGKPVDYRNCIVLHRDDMGVFRPADHCEAKEKSTDDSDKWTLAYVWYHSSGGKPPVAQDTFKRGPRKGVGKFRRVKAGTKKSEYIDKLKGTGLSFFYAQILMGDSVDGYGGLEGCGMTTAYEVLKDCRTEWELYQAALNEYRKVYGDDAEERLTLQGRMAWMQTYPGELWNPPTSMEDSSYPYKEGKVCLPS